MWKSLANIDKVEADKSSRSAGFHRRVKVRKKLKELLELTICQ